MALRDTISVHVVDDMSTSRGILVRSLEQLGIRNVQQGGEPEAALRSMLLDPPDLVLSDLHMPGMDGLALLANLRRERRTRDTRFILVTGRPCAEVRARAISLGSDGVLSKPYELADLQDHLEAAVGHL